MPQNTTGQPTTATVIFTESGNPATFEVEIHQTLTGEAAIRGLVDQAGFPPPSASLSYALKLKRTGTEIPLDRPLMESGVQSGDIVIVVRTDVAAGSMS